MSILRRIISDIEADRREWEFSALSPQEQAKERERMDILQEMIRRHETEYTNSEISEAIRHVAESHAGEHYTYPPFS